MFVVSFSLEFIKKRKISVFHMFYRTAQVMKSARSIAAVLNRQRSSAVLNALVQRSRDVEYAVIIDSLHGIKVGVGWQCCALVEASRRLVAWLVHSVLTSDDQLVVVELHIDLGRVQISWQGESNRDVLVGAVHSGEGRLALKCNSRHRGLESGHFQVEEVVSTRERLVSPSSVSLHHFVHHFSLTGDHSVEVVESTGAVDGELAAWKDVNTWVVEPWIVQVIDRHRMSN